ncbi:hypothetical protein CBL_20209, partial [Carabus blaptoides fortunei]
MDRRKRGTKRPLSLGELEEIAAQFGEQSFSESDGSDDVYAPSETDDDDVVSESDTEDNDGGNSARTDNPNGVIVPNVAVEVHPKSEERNASDTSTSYILWSEPDSTFVPKYTIPDKRSCKLHSDIKTNLTSLEYFKKTFPSSLYMYIAQCTNERLEIFKKEKKNKRLSIRETDRGEIQIVIGCMLVMSYNHAPSFSNYWSTHSVIGKSVYPKGYITRQIQGSCIKNGTFKKCRQDSSYQSIDESMTKFKGRFFTSVTLLQSLKYPALGTCMANRKNLPKINDKLSRGESIFKCSSTGLMFAKWQDTKEVLMLSNCHNDIIVTVQKTMKDGSKSDVSCPEMISFYREIMGGVDLADQMAGLYDLDRKSSKWWKKVFYRLIMMAAVNAWILSNEVNGRKTSFLNFLVPLAEQLIAEGCKTASVQRSCKKGRISKRRKSFRNVSMHLPVEGSTRRRCSRCSDAKKQTRTKTMCKECQIPLCK